MKAFIDLITALALLVLFALSPFVTIWALNTIIPTLALPFTIWTWLAVIWLHTVAVGIFYRSH